jgi:Protochlamydia outer membrane protein
MGPLTKVKKSRLDSWGTRGLSLLVILAIACTVFAQDRESTVLSKESPPFIWGRPSPVLEIGLGAYFSRGWSSWQISFPSTQGPGRSALDFKDLDSILPYASLVLSHPQSLVGLTVIVGSGSGSKGSGRDSDYLSGGLTYDARMDVSSDTTFWSADLQTTVSSASGTLWHLKPFAGWQQYREKVKLTNGRWTTLRGVPADLPILGLDSRYEFNWEALRLGLSGGVDFVRTPRPGLQQVGLKASCALFPYTRYRGEGRWNLRADLNQNPSFAHRAETTGWGGGEALLALVYRPGVRLEFESGVRYSVFRAEDGTNVAYISDGTTTVSRLDEAKSERVGFYLQITGRF